MSPHKIYDPGGPALNRVTPCPTSCCTQKTPTLIGGATLKKEVVRRHLFMSNETSRNTPLLHAVQVR